MTPARFTGDATSWPSDAMERAAAVAAAGLRRPVRPEMPAVLAHLLATDADPRVRAAALGALARLAGDPSPAAARPPADPSDPTALAAENRVAVRAGAAEDPAAGWAVAARDPDPTVRRRAAELAPAFAGHSGRVAGGLLALLADPDVAVAEAAAWALGELGAASVETGAVGRLAEAAQGHGDPLVREAAVAALGALGHPDGLDAVLAGCRDKPAIRRRAVLALAAFDGPEVDAALGAARDDKDWQTRQAAEDLLGS